MKLARDMALWAVWGPFKRLLWLLPATWGLRLARLLGRVYYHVAGGKRRGMEEAARLILGNNTPPETVRGLVRQAAVNFVCNDVEVLLFPTLTPARTQAITRLEGQEHLDAALAAGHGVILAFGHFGANQMIMPAIGHRGYRMCQLSAPAWVLNERLPEARSALVRRTREMRWAHEASLPVQHINIFGNLKEAFACLKRGEVLGVAVDGGGGERKLPATFLGRRALFSIGAAGLAMRTGAPLVPCAMLRDPATGINTLRIRPALRLEESPRKDKDTAVLERNLQRLISILEEDVLQRPDHYLYFLAFRLHMALKEDPLFLDA
ncbi:lysophospholipid acyltransferase family protein [Megalodesulfovibrio gigas]|uniref:Putative lipid A biosynthesis acyltransferase n=1 Tax=Megalodesulfovibrio gigas (strain ATCC 19364 / DSM 1382 / NCIMB 9332 / VKM B-1759) TaxID=1121448 RepID=T2G759_MEGG1|nr:lysophospholipid acyltransferase family protein [Megalodesulfovibrio gigas]AGW12029.1 putative lipid A biosynthesis acyltransferase [Megalodesulfovibrio gigas DSM 1382 = ATCC 19364]